MFDWIFQLSSKYCTAIILLSTCHSSLHAFCEVGDICSSWMVMRLIYSARRQSDQVLTHPLTLEPHQGGWQALGCCSQIAPVWDSTQYMCNGSDCENQFVSRCLINHPVTTCGLRRHWGKCCVHAEKYCCQNLNRLLTPGISKSLMSTIRRNWS